MTAPSISLDKRKIVCLTADLVLSKLNGKVQPIEKHAVEKIAFIDLTQVKNIDSAGLAYLAQLKIINPNLSFSGYSNEIVLLSSLYGLNFLFSNKNEQVL